LQFYSAKNFEHEEIRPFAVIKISRLALHSKRRAVTRDKREFMLKKPITKAILVVPSATVLKVRQGE